MTTPLEPRRARSIMMTHLDARVETATSDELEATRRHLADVIAAASTMSGWEATGVGQIVQALDQMLFIEVQLRDREIERQLLDLLAHPPHSGQGADDAPAL
jgi:hypothetical protein